MYFLPKKKGGKQMKVQDKIFLHPNYKGEVGANWLTFPLTEKDECYIRKDALLEWLKLAVECYSHPDTVNVVDTIRCEGKKWAFQDVINKIESL